MAAVLNRAPQLFFILVIMNIELVIVDLMEALGVSVQDIMNHTVCSAKKK